MTSVAEEYFVGVDVGSGSARAALVNQDGVIKKVAVMPIKTWNPQLNFYQQSSDDIWNACCVATKEVTGSVAKNSVKGIGFDATCSLVAVDRSGNPVSVSPSGEEEQNVILWLDHRAEHEANEINNLKHSLLRYVGGKISLEMELPKLLWLKRNLRQQCWNRACYFFDLPDFLSWKATGSDSRSLCTVICKWLYDATAGQWDRKFLTSIGLDDLLLDDFSKIGKIIKAPGLPCGNGLTSIAANQMGLLPGTCVSTSIIDAHAGVLGLIGAKNSNLPIELDSRLSLICGTSTCHMALSKNALFVPGVWGPYHGVLGMGFWLNEGGQSTTGKLLDHVIETHAATKGILNKIPKEMHISEYLNKLVYKMSETGGLISYDMLTKNIHVWPDFHGNRSPLADPLLRGMVSGLSLSAGEEDLALLYLATIQSLAYGTKHIISSLEGAGHKGIKSVLICGGLSKNKLFVQTHADVIGCTVLIPKEEQSVLLGSAILAATASGKFSSVQNAVRGMACQAHVVEPNNRILDFHKKKYEVFLRMVEDQKIYKNIMDSS